MTRPDSVLGLRSLQLVVALILGAASSSARPQSPPQEPARTQITETYATAAPVGGIQFGAIKVRFNTTSLNDILPVLGGVAIQHSGDAGDSLYWICLTLEGKGKSRRVWLVSDGEMGGSGHLVTSFYTKILRIGGEPTTTCPAPDAEIESPIFDNGLGLGSTAVEIEAALGARPTDTKGWWSYQYEGRTTITGGGTPVEFDLLSSIDFRLYHGRVVAIRASEIESN